MKRRDFLGLLVTFAISLSCALPTHAEEVKDRYKIGVILSLTGDGASIGQSVRNGVLLAYDNLSAEEKSRIELFFEDDRYSSAGAVAAWNKLISLQKVNAVISAFSNNGQVLAPLAENRKIPFIVVATDPKIIAGRKFSNLLWVTPEAESEIIIPEALSRGYKKIARVSTQHDGPIAANASFDRYNKNQISLELDDYYAGDTKDFKASLSKIHAKKDLDAIMISLMPGHIGIFCRQARQLGIALPIFGWETFEDPNEVKASDGTLIGQWYVNADDPSQEFSAQYVKRFPDAAMVGAANGHDALLLMATASKENSDSTGVANFLRKVKDFPGALGKTTATGDGRFMLPAAVKVVTKNGFERLAKQPIPQAADAEEAPK